MNRLERLLRPRSIAVFGGVQAAAVVKQCLKMGFAGDIWPVHPSKDEVAGVKAYRSVAELPGAPDAAFVGVNRFLTIDIVRELCASAAPAARSASPPASSRPAATMPTASGCSASWSRRPATCRSSARTATA